MIEHNNIKAIGKFQKTHALKGELNAILDIDMDYLADGNPIVVDMDGINVPFYCDSVRTKGNTSFLVKLQGVDTEEEASKFVNKIIFAPKDLIEEYKDSDEDDEYYTSEDLMDYTVQDEERGVIGVVKGLNTDTDNVLLLIETESQNTVMIPFVEDFVKEIDDENRIITIDVPAELLDLN